MQPRDLSTHEPYVAGRGTEEVARELGVDPDSLVKLASNENPLGPSPRAIDAVVETVDSMHVYPKASHTDLVDALAARWAVDPAQIWLANGGDGALDYLARAMLEPGDRVLVPRPGFAYYAMSARFHHSKVGTYPLEKATGFAISVDAILDSYDGERIIYLTSPHNPTGSVVTVEEIERLAEQTDPETLIVVDEAYAEFADTISAVTLLDGRDDVAVLRTFSKAYGLAGIRLGYAVVPPAWAEAYARVNTPFAASELACRAGRAALGDEDHLDATVEAVRESRSMLTRDLVATTWPSQANFVLAEVGDATTVCDTLQHRGIIVRDCTSFGLPECIRISCGTVEETDRAISVLNELLQ